VGITIKYKGLKDAPLLVTESGVYPSVKAEQGFEPDLTRAGELHVSGNPSEIRKSLRKIDQQNVLDTVYSKIEDLSRQIDNMHVPESDLVLRAKTAVSSNPDALTATADDLAATPARHTVEIRHPAQSKTILSTPLNPIETVDLDEGDYEFTVTVGGEERTVSVNVTNNESQADTNEQFLATVARAINGVDPRIHADVVYGEEDAYDPSPRSRPMNRTVRLSVTSTEDGQGTDYNISDVEDGYLAGKYGLGASPPSRAARVVVGGELRDQSSNTLELDGGHVLADIKDSTVSPLNIDVSRGPEVITGEITEIVASYNDLVRYMDANADLLRPSLKDRVVRPLEDRAGLMRQVGLRATVQGRVEMSENFGDRVIGAFDQMRSILVGEGGWAEALQLKLNQILDVEQEAFAADLSRPTLFQVRQQAFDLAEALTTNIINGYY
jgi:flagellar capping protein FliD